MNSVYRPVTAVFHSVIKSLVGSLMGVVKSCWMSGRQSRKPASREFIRNLCHVGGEIVLGTDRWCHAAQISRRLTSSSRLECPCLVLL
jgi:hypothetical protein